MDTLSIEEVSQDLKLSKRSVLRLAKEEELPTLTKPFPGGFKYVVPLNLYLEWKKQSNGKKKQNNCLYSASFLKEQQIIWLEWGKNGALVGKPMSEATLIKNDYSLNAYWKRLPRRYQRTPLISVDCLRAVLSSIDPKMFATKEQIYKGIISFTKYLVKNNYCEAS